MVQKVHDTRTGKEITIVDCLIQIVALEQELHMIDELLARRPALADFNTRYDKISHAIKVASQKDALEQRCKELELFKSPGVTEYVATFERNAALEAENAELRKRLQTTGLDN